MKREFVPYEQALELKELGFNENCLAFYNFEERLMPIDTDFTNFRELSDDLTKAPLYQQAFRWFREKYNFKYSIGITNICVYHIPHIPVSNYHTTFILQDCESYEDAQLQCIKAFIDHAKQK